MARAKKSPEIIAFVGPSLGGAEARALAPCEVWAPARQGDVWRAIERRPKVIALVDGVFEAQPSVWHHELLAAIDAGIFVVGGGSMGALRAAELHAHGVVGVGRIFEWYRDGVINDDSEVALLHADAEHDFRPLTIPLVNVRFAADRARVRRILAPAEADDLVKAASGIFYQERSWPAVLKASSLGDAKRERLRAFLEKTKPDLKADDARGVLRKAAKLALKPNPAAKPSRAQSALVRQRRLAAHAEVLKAMRARPDAHELRDAGLRRALLSGWARTRGFRVTPRQVQQERERWLRALKIPKRDEERFLRSLALDEAQLLRLLEDVLLERRMLEDARRMLPDGPGDDEALAAEARIRGQWPRAPDELRDFGRPHPASSSSKPAMKRR